MSIKFDSNTGRFIDTRCPEIPLFADRLSVCYTLDGDDITRGKKPSATPYVDRSDALTYENGIFKSADTASALKVTEKDSYLEIELHTEASDLSEYGINLPLNFMGKPKMGGWENQFLFNSVYASEDKRIIYAYFTRQSGHNLAIAITSEADGWKMDYSPFSWGHYFHNLKLLASYDKAYKTGSCRRSLRFVIVPTTDFESCLDSLSRIYGIPLISCNLNGGKIGEKITLNAHGGADSLIEISQNGERILPFDKEYVLCNEGETALIPVRNGVKGAPCTLFAFADIVALFKKSMDTVDLEIIKKHTDSNLCEHQSWLNAMLTFLITCGSTLSEDERIAYEKKVLSQLDILTEPDVSKAVPRQTILADAHGRFGAYNVYKSARVQELYNGIDILIDAFMYFKSKKYLDYAFGASDCLVRDYMRDDGRIEVLWDDGNHEDYSTVCAPMIPLIRIMKLASVYDGERYEKYATCVDNLAEHLYRRGIRFPTEGSSSSLAEEEMEDGSISCTALSLLCYCFSVRRDEKYLAFAEKILKIHDAWVIKSPICQMNGSSLRWWETQWEGDADGPAICAGHAWTIWRAEADYLFYLLTKSKEHRDRAQRGFMTNLAKIRPDGRSYAIYNPDEINGGGLVYTSDEVNFRIAKRFADTEDCGLSRYVWTRLFYRF